MVWTILVGIATLISTAAYIVTALYIRAELKSLEKDRYITVTHGLFQVWQDPEFMEAQLWLIHRLKERTWEEFVRAHRADKGENYFHRVGSFYDRVGRLSRSGLIDTREILDTMGGYAIAVWQSIEPLVKEARSVENSLLFDDFERIIPDCYECYVPTLGKGVKVTTFEPPDEVHRVSIRQLKSKMDRHEAFTLLDVRQPAHIDEDPRRIPGAIYVPPDAVEEHLGALPREQELIVYCA